jgi:GNAT superfamily N-acetyltransferase
MKARLANLADMAEVSEMARGAAEHRPSRVFNELRFRATFVDYLTKASPVFWVTEDASGLTGFLLGDYAVHRGFDGLFVQQEVLFVKPEKRGTRAAALLMNELIRWAEAIGANEIIGGNENSFQTEQTAKFLAKLGFKCVGLAMRREM